MTRPDDELGRLLRDALHEGARAAVPDDRPVPPMRDPAAPSAVPSPDVDGDVTIDIGLDTHPAGVTGSDASAARLPRPRSGGSHRRAITRSRARWAAPLLTAAAVLATVLVVLSVTSRSPRHNLAGSATATVATSSTTASPTPATATGTGVSAASRTSTVPLPPPATTRPAPYTGGADPNSPSVHLKSLYIGDGSVVGVGMPVIIAFDSLITDKSAFVDAATVTVDNRPAHGAWYFTYTPGRFGGPIEASYRTSSYWPAHAHIRVDLPVAGLSAGTGQTYDADLTLDFRTGAANIATVSSAKHRLTLVSDGRQVLSTPVSLGATRTPTMSGTKIVMGHRAQFTSTDGARSVVVHDALSLTDGGEYIYAAPWNVRNIGRVNNTNGCTDVTPAAARTLFDTLQLGDVVRYPDAAGSVMTLGAGLGGWDVPWKTWQAGGYDPS